MKKQVVRIFAGFFVLVGIFSAVAVLFVLVSLVHFLLLSTITKVIVVSGAVIFCAWVVGLVLEKAAGA